mmetsp:Transcript_40049/g.105060  ORF Transcript_40049/g.105060 Transcript_40049/m.105060 type:complete len:184 (+) Transcript_40049:697-1248(+)
MGQVCGVAERRAECHLKQVKALLRECHAEPATTECDTGLECSSCGDKGDCLGLGGKLVCKICHRAASEAGLLFTKEEGLCLEALDEVLDAPYNCFRPGPQPACVCDGIFLAGLAEATDPALLSKHGITRILSCVSVAEIDRFCAKNNVIIEDLDLDYHHAGIEQRVVEVLDSPQSDITHVRRW